MLHKKEGGVKNMWRQKKNRQFNRKEKRRNGAEGIAPPTEKKIIIIKSRGGKWGKE